MGEKTELDRTELDSLGIITIEEYTHNSLKLIMEKLKIEPIELVRAIIKQREAKPIKDNKDKETIKKGTHEEGQTHGECPHCQEPLELDKDNYCTNCGSKIKPKAI